MTPPVEKNNQKIPKVSYFIFSSDDMQVSKMHINNNRNPNANNVTAVNANHAGTNTKSQEISQNPSSFRPIKRNVKILIHRKTSRIYIKITESERE